MESQRRSSPTYHWFIMTGILLLIAASRILRLHEFRLNADEIWSIWQTFGTFEQIIHWTPYDWPPLYYLALGMWSRTTSLIPESLRLFSMLIFLIGAAFSYKVGQRSGGRPAGIGTMLVYAALGYNILLSVEVRGYALLLGLMPVALWLLIRYFERDQWYYGAALGVTLAAMFYTSYTSSLAIIMLGIYSLIVYTPRLLRWWLPTVITIGLTLPQILQIQATAVRRVSATSQLETPILPQALADLFYNWAGTHFGLWVLVFLGAVGYLFYRQRWNRRNLALLVWVAGMPLLLYFTNPVLGFFSARYAWWVMLGMALWIGWGVGHLPRLPRLLAYSFLVVVLFLPLPMDRYSIWGNRISPLHENFKWLKQHLQVGDLLIADTDNECGRAEEWDYYTRIHFQTGLHFSAVPGDHERVWYIIRGDRHNTDLHDLISQGRILRKQIGPSRCLFLLYEAPPLADGLLFANGLRFHGANLLDTNGNSLPAGAAYHEGETVHLRLWWSVDHQLDQPYLIGTYIGQQDLERGTGIQAFPEVTFPANPPSMEAWQSGQYYIEEREIPLRRSLSARQYKVLLNVVDPSTNQPVSMVDLPQDGNLYEINLITVKSY